MIVQYSKSFNSSTYWLINDDASRQAGAALGNSGHSPPDDPCAKLALASGIHASAEKKAFARANGWFS
jgi:hypothetical protein